VWRKRIAAKPYQSLLVKGEAEYSMHIVYILRSEKYRKRLYIGLTEDLENRIKEHNHNESRYSKNYAPWDLETYIVFKDKSQAVSFEKYLKSGSGFAFLKKRLLPQRQNVEATK